MFKASSNRIPIESVLITQELKSRATREANYKLENETLRSLGRDLARSPAEIVPRLCDAALRVCRADSAGICMLEKENGVEFFRWRGVAGELSAFLNRTTPKNFSPSGTVAERGSTVLMNNPAAHFEYIAELKVPICEVLLEPLYADGKPIGTLWVAFHSTEKHFDLEDSRMLQSLAEFAWSANQTLGLHQTLKKSQAELRDFFMQAPIPLVILDGPNHFFALANPPYEKLIGRKATGKTVLEVFSREEVSDFIPLLDGVYNTGIPYIGKELPLNIPDERGVVQHLWIDLGYYPFRDSVGQIKGILAVVQDVTEQVKARKLIEATSRELANERRKLEGAFTNSPAALALFQGPRHRIERVNGPWVELVGPRNYLNKTYHEAYPEFAGTALPAILDTVFATGETYSARAMKVRVETTLGTLEDRYYDFTYVRISDADGEPYGLFCHALNVTRQVLTLQAIEGTALRLNRTVRDLELERELRERFVNALTHDMRTPMTAAKMSAQFLKRAPNDPEVVKTVAQRINVNMDRADFMIRDLLDMSRLKAGESIALAPGPCDLKQVIARAVARLEEIYGRRFALINAEGPVVGYWDGSVIERAVENLASNAIKYGAPGSPVTIKLSIQSQWATIAIHNHGNPISESDQKTLFASFHRSQSAISSGQKGWGIGLTLVKSIAEAHGGTVGVVSAENSGTIFDIRLPLDRKAPNELPDSNDQNHSRS